MRLLAAVLGLTVALLAGASIAGAAQVGANDDLAKHSADGGLGVYRDMVGLGLRQTVIGVRFLPSDPMTIQDKQLLDRVIPNAVKAGLRVVLAVYPYPPKEIQAGVGSPTLFAGYVGVLASVYPQVRQFVIGNEPNQPAFWRPQFDASGKNASASAFGPYLAAAYDVLKAVDAEISVVGVGLSPRGNDRPDARNNISTSPVRFLRALGSWYRRSGRTRPLMDAFSFHPYPNRATDPLDRGYAWPNAGFVNLDRVRQALWDAFHGTGQPTTLNGLKIHLDEVGWQVDTAGRAGYTGTENVPVTDELTQAAIYGELIRRSTCDPDVAEVSFFGFRDDGLRTGFQAALLRADGTVRPSAAAVQAAIASSVAGCQGEKAYWAPRLEVVGAQVLLDVEETAVTARIAAGEDARGRLCLRSVVREWANHARFRFAVIPGKTLCRVVAVPGLKAANVAVPTPMWARGPVQVDVRLEAESNRTRRTVVIEQTTIGP